MCGYQFGMNQGLSVCLCDGQEEVMEVELREGGRPTSILSPLCSSVLLMIPVLMETDRTLTLAEAPDLQGEVGSGGGEKVQSQCAFHMSPLSPKLEAFFCCS